MATSGGSCYRREWFAAPKNRRPTWKAFDETLILLRLSTCELAIIACRANAFGMDAADDVLDEINVAPASGRHASRNVPSDAQAEP